MKNVLNLLARWAPGYNIWRTLLSEFDVLYLQEYSHAAASHVRTGQGESGRDVLQPAQHFLYPGQWRGELSPLMEKFAICYLPWKKLIHGLYSSNSPMPLIKKMYHHCCFIFRDLSRQCLLQAFNIVTLISCKISSLTVRLTT